MDLELLKKEVGVGEGMMEEMMEVEVEKIEGMMGKIEWDGEKEDVKDRERVLWEKM